MVPAENELNSIFAKITTHSGTTLVGAVKVDGLRMRDLACKGCTVPSLIKVQKENDFVSDSL